MLDKESVTTSDFQQQVDFQRAVEGELGKTIQSINGVLSASVHLALPQQNVFNDGTQKPTAAVMLTTTAGTQLTTQQVQSVVYLVSSAVTNMSPDGVTVTDQNGNVLAAAGGGITDSVGTSTQTQQTQDYNNRLATSLENMINQVVGQGHSVVTVNAALDFNKTSSTKNTYVYDPKAPPLSQQRQLQDLHRQQRGQRRHARRRRDHDDRHHDLRRGVVQGEQQDGQQRGRHRDRDDAERAGCSQ